jgi:hypothetical protein
MKFWIAILTAIIIFSSFSSFSPSDISCYSSEYVQISEVKYENEPYKIVTMRREGDRVRAKYFAAKDYNGNSVYSRFLQWQRSNPNVILLSSGTYMDNYGNPQGLTIDNGVMVNQNLISGKMDALVIVYATGGIAVTDLKLGDLQVKGIARKLDLRNNGNDLDDFIEWAKREEATVFQTHLLIYKNQIKIDQRSSSDASRERRFLAVGYDETKKLVHVIVHAPLNSTIYDGSKKVLDFLHYKDMDVTFMINLDTGAQDAFELHNQNCTINSTIMGKIDPRDAVNLLAYYFN